MNPASICDRLRSLFRVLTPRLAPSKFSYAQKASSTEKVLKPPVPVYGLTGRYATALFSAASKMNLLERVEKDMIKVESTLKEDPKLRNMLSHPKASRLVTADDMRAVLARLKLSPPSNNFLVVLAENKRLSILEKVIEKYRILMLNYRGEITCELISAKSITEADMKKIKTELETAYKNRRSVTVINTVDPDIIGGYILKVDDYYVDMSIKTKLQKYKDMLSASLLV